MGLEQTLCELSGDAGDGGPDEHWSWSGPLLFRRVIQLHDVGVRILPLLDGLPGEENVLYLTELLTIVLIIVFIV